jgi:hypothetical protein
VSSGLDEEKISISFKNLQFGVWKKDVQFGAGRFSMKKS